ncbi:MAG: KH domain-containing protein [Candidatus ainarchaeum sp.]|nr:KH domain-containing protein [Candidatus ainarchaeum sp.]
MEEEIKIPEERIGVIIGPQGNTKKSIMKKTNTKIEVDSMTGDVIVEGEGEDFFKAIDIVKAISRGFSPERAFKLLEKNFLLKIINVQDFVGKNSSAQKAKKGRIIGKKGLARKEIEEKTNSLISVYGKTVSIIASTENIELAQKAIELLLKGAAYETVDSRIKDSGKTRFEL